MEDAVSVLMAAWMSAAALAQDPNTWADKIILDPRSESVLFVWFDGNQAERTETVPFSAVKGLERLPTYEGQDEELALRTTEGNVLLASMGRRAREDAIVFSAVLGQKVRVLDPSTPRMVPSDIAATYRGPRLVLGSVKGPSAMEPISTEYVESSDFFGIDIADGDIREERVFEEPRDFRGPNDGNGVLDKTAIDLVVQGKMPTFRNCYQRQLQRTPNLGSGRVTMQFIIGEDGFVTKARVASTTLRNDDVEQCLQQNLKGTPFPLPRNGTVVVTYPFTFNRK